MVHHPSRKFAAHQEDFTLLEAPRVAAASDGVGRGRSPPKLAKQARKLVEAERAGDGQPHGVRDEFDVQHWVTARAAPTRLSQTQS